jgi:hypothetical protein
MGLLTNLKKAVAELEDSRRPELPIREDILEREKGFAWDSNREAWLVEHTYLSEGGLDALKKHSLYKPVGVEPSSFFAYYASLKGRDHSSRKVSVSVPIRTTEDEAYLLAERNLKLSLCHRGCNAGVFYRNYKKEEKVFAEATPAVLTCE